MIEPSSILHACGQNYRFNHVFRDVKKGISGIRDRGFTFVYFSVAEVLIMGDFRGSSVIPG